MFIITKEKSLRQKNIIGIFDLDNSTVSAVTKNFLSSAEKSNKIAEITKPHSTVILPKSFVLTDSNNIFNKKKISRKNKKNTVKSEKSKDFKIYFSSHVSSHIYKLSK